MDSRKKFLSDLSSTGQQKCSLGSSARRYGQHPSTSKAEVGAAGSGPGKQSGAVALLLAADTARLGVTTRAPPPWSPLHTQGQMARGPDKVRGHHPREVRRPLLANALQEAALSTNVRILCLYIYSGVPFAKAIADVDCTPEGPTP